MFGRWRKKKGFFYGLWQVAKRLSPYDIDYYGELFNIGQGGGREGRQARRKAKQ